MNQQLLEEIIDNFQLAGDLVKWANYGTGHIYDTLLLEFCDENAGGYKIVLQHMNQNIFKCPVELMENVMNVTTYLQKRIADNGGDPERETLNFITDKDGAPYYCDSDGEYWRAYRYVDDVDCYDLAECPEDFYQSGVAFGYFQKE